VKEETAYLKVSDPGSYFCPLPLSLSLYLSRGLTFILKSWAAASGKGKNSRKNTHRLFAL
jgi:hypothetical protein